MNLKKTFGILQLQYNKKAFIKKIQPIQLISLATEITKLVDNIPIYLKSTSL